MRRAASWVLAALAALALTVGVLAQFANRTIFSADGFADRTEATLRSPAVSAELARRMTDGAIRAQPDLIAVRPLVTGAAEGVVSSAAFRSVVRAAARDVHRSVFDRDATTVTLTVVDAGVLLNEAVNHLRPDLAQRIPPGLHVTLLRRGRAGDRAHARRGRTRAPARGDRAGRGAPARRGRGARRAGAARRRRARRLRDRRGRRPRRAHGDLRAARADRERGRAGRAAGVAGPPRAPGAGRSRAPASSSAWRRRRCCGRSSSCRCWRAGGPRSFTRPIGRGRGRRGPWRRSRSACWRSSTR